MRLATLRGRVTTWYVGLLAGALVVFGAALYLGLKSYLRTSLEHALSGEARAIVSSFVSSEEEMGQTWMRGEIFEAYSPEISGKFIRVTRQDGTVLYTSGDKAGTRQNWPGVAPPSLEGGETFREASAQGGRRLMIFTQPYTSSSGRRYLVEVGESRAPMDKMLSSLLKVLLVITPCLLVAAALGGQLLMAVLLRPLVILTEQAERIGTSHLGERLTVIATGDELERLSLSLNRMISRLEEALAHNRRFSADVSHELRTPLTILRGELEQMLQTSRLDQEQRESLGSSLEEIDRMAKIVESLLTIARLDSGTDAMELKPVDLSGLARWTVEQMHLLAEEKHIQIESVLSGPVPILADAGRIKQVLVNLLDNAIKYTPDGGTVTLTVLEQAARRTAVLEVSDTGIGIPEDSLPHVFERFYRSDKARTRESGGTGLGLSIVKAIAKAHDAMVSIDSVEGKGTRVRVELPLSAEPVPEIAGVAPAEMPSHEIAGARG